MATYMLLLYAEDADEETRAQRWAELPEWDALTEELRERAIWIANAALHPVESATTRSSRSSGRPRSVSPSVPSRGWRCWRRCSPTRRWPATNRCTRPTPSCCAGPAARPPTRTRPRSS
jgi:hypothetical protein